MSTGFVYARPALHLERAPEQFDRKGTQHLQDIETERRGGEPLSAWAMEHGGAVLHDMLVPHRREALHGIPSPKTVNIDHLSVSDNRVVLWDTKAIRPGTYHVQPVDAVLHAQDEQTFESGNATLQDLREQVLDIRRYDRLAGHGTVARSLSMAVRELTWALQARGISDVTVSQRLSLIKTGEGRVRLPGAGSRPFTSTYFAHRDDPRRLIRLPSAVLVGSATEDDVRGHAEAAHPNPEPARPDLLEALTAIWDAGEAIRQARMAEDRRNGLRA